MICQNMFRKDTILVRQFVYWQESCPPGYYPVGSFGDGSNQECAFCTATYYCPGGASGQVCFDYNSRVSQINLSETLNILYRSYSMTQCFLALWAILSLSLFLFSRGLLDPAACNEFLYRSHVLPATSRFLEQMPQPPAPGCSTCRLDLAKNDLTMAMCGKDQ